MHVDLRNRHCDHAHSRRHERLVGCPEKFWRDGRRPRHGLGRAVVGWFLLGGPCAGKHFGFTALDLTGFFPGKHLIHCLANKMQDL